MNKLVKTILLVVYTLALFTASILIINFSFKANRYNSYSETPEDEYLTVNLQMMEIRKTAAEQSSDYEYSKYDMYLFVTKKTNVVIENVYSYLAVKSQKGEYSYTETSSSKSFSSGVYQNSTMSFLNSSTAFAYNQVVVEDGAFKEYDNHIPAEVFVRIAYDVKVETETTDDNGETTTVKETVHKELEYSFKVSEINFKDFSNYEERSIDDKTVVYGNDYFSINIYKTTTDKTSTSSATNNFKVLNLKAITANIPSGVQIDKIDLTIYAEVTDESVISSKYFDKYIRIFTYNGALTTARAISATRTCSLSTAYKIGKIYFTATITLSNKEVVKTCYYINSSDLASN